MSHGNNGNNGNFYFAPCGAFPLFPLFLWDNDIACTFFLCPTEITEITEIFYFASCGVFPSFPLYDYPHISAIDPEKGLRSVTVGRNDLRMMWMMAICTLNECPNGVCGRPRKGRCTHSHLSGHGKSRRDERPQAGGGVLKGRNPCYAAHHKQNSEGVTDYEDKQSRKESVTPSGFGWVICPISRGSVCFAHSTSCLWSHQPFGLWEVQMRIII